MKILNFYTVALISIFTFTACNKDYLEVEPKGQFLSENYYADQTQAFSALVGVYDVLRKNSGGFENIVAMMNAGSDDHVAGGGGSSDGAGIQGFSNFTIDQTIIPGKL